MNSQESSNPSTSSPLQSVGLTDESALKLAAQAAFLQSFAENLIEPEFSVDEVMPRKKTGESDFGWRAGLRW